MLQDTLENILSLPRAGSEILNAELWSLEGFYLPQVP